MQHFPYFSVDKSGTRYFWAAWLKDPSEPPDFSGYTRAKESAVRAAVDALRVMQAQQLKGEAASRWRGILQCKYCQSKDLHAELKETRPHPELSCKSCGRFNKWLSHEQLLLFQQLQTQKVVSN